MTPCRLAGNRKGSRILQLWWGCWWACGSGQQPGDCFSAWDGHDHRCLSYLKVICTKWVCAFSGPSRCSVFSIWQPWASPCKPPHLDDHLSSASIERKIVAIRKRNRSYTDFVHDSTVVFTESKPFSTVQSEADCISSLIHRCCNAFSDSTEELQHTEMLQWNIHDISGHARLLHNPDES